MGQIRDRLLEFFEQEERQSLPYHLVTLNHSEMIFFCIRDTFFSSQNTVSNMFQSITEIPGVAVMEVSRIGRILGAFRRHLQWLIPLREIREGRVDGRAVV